MTARLRARLVLGLVAVLLAACVGPGSDPSAPYFPSQRAIAHPAPPADSAPTGAVAGSVLVRGPISRPNLQLTPGVVAVTDRLAVCQGPKRMRVPLSPWDQQTVYDEYGISAKQARRYGMDYLVPLQLGGAPVVQNAWPVLVRGLGYHEKESLNARLRVSVCRGDIPLEVAQKQITTDWFALWVKLSA
jgi:hypothetical protein